MERKVVVNDIQVFIRITIVMFSFIYVAIVHRLFVRQTCHIYDILCTFKSLNVCGMKDDVRHWYSLLCTNYSLKRKNS